MKMESTVTAPCSGRVVAVADLAVGGSLVGDDVVAVIEPSDAAGPSTIEVRREDTWLPVLDDVAKLQSLAHARLAPGSDEPGVVRQRNRGKLTCRERIDALLDPGSFHEVGSLAGFASYDADGQIVAFTPANHVGGTGTIDGRGAVVCADDFTSRGGHADGAIGAKSLHLDRLSTQLLIPAVRLLDGSSGGGSVAAMVPEQSREGDSTAQESAARSPPGGRGCRVAAGRSSARTSASRSTPNSWPSCPSSTCCSAASSASAQPRPSSGTST